MKLAVQFGNRPAFVIVDGVSVYVGGHDVWHIAQRKLLRERAIAVHPDSGGSRDAFGKAQIARRGFMNRERAWYAHIRMTPPGCAPKTRWCMLSKRIVQILRCSDSTFSGICLELELHRKHSRVRNVVNRLLRLGVIETYSLSSLRQKRGRVATTHYRLTKLEEQVS
jgi:hypothetical protein